MRVLAEKFNLGYVVETGNHHHLAEALIKMSDIKLRASFFNKQLYDKLSYILSVEAGAKVIFDKISGMKNEANSILPRRI